MSDLEKPEIDFPAGEPPTELEITDIVVGPGAEANAGHHVTVHYVGVAFSTGEEFDASWNRGQPLQFRLGRRKLIIPPHMAYGDRGAGGAIKPGETLIFVVDLLG